MRFGIASSSFLDLLASARRRGQDQFFDGLLDQTASRAPDAPGIRWS
jgi:hypothetical protein